MAENKKSIIVYSDWIHIFEKLTDEEAGQLIKHFFNYVNDKSPISDNRLIEIVFEPIRQTLKRDLEKWSLIRYKRSEIGKLGGKKSVEARLTKNNQMQPIASNIQANQAVSVSVSDSVINNKYVYSLFYDEQIKLSEEKGNSVYKLFVGWLYGTNINRRPLTKLLNLKDQIRFDSFEKYLSEYGQALLKQTILDLDNYTKKTYSSFNTTLNKWLLKTKQK